MTEGLPNTNTSMSVHTSKLVAAQMLVLMTAIDESTLAAYGSPPLNPAHPSHSNPAPANINSTLFGGNRSRSFVNLGPTCQFQNSHRYIVRTDYFMTTKIKSCQSVIKRGRSLLPSTISQAGVVDQDSCHSAAVSLISTNMHHNPRSNSITKDSCQTMKKGQD